MDSKAYQAEYDDILSRSDYGRCKEHAKVKYPGENILLATAWVRSDLIMEWELLAAKLLNEIKHAENQIANQDDDPEVFAATDDLYHRQSELLRWQQEPAYPRDPARDGLD